MKILLFGDFSACHQNLRAGLNYLGHEVTLAGGRDGFKGLRQDVLVESNMSGVLGAFQNQLKPYRAVSKLGHFDVCQAINPFFPNARFLSKRLIYRKLRQRSDRFYFLAAGTDAVYCRNANQCMQYSPLEDFYRFDVRPSHLKKGVFYMNTESSYRYNCDMMEHADGIIPVMYDYAVCYRGFPNVKNIIPLPIDVESVKYTGPVLGQKIKIFHGVSRYGFKGTRHIKQAFDILKARYGRKVEFIVAGPTPFVEYLRLLESADIVVDQVNSYSSGMNALYAMAMGKVVMGGAERTARLAENDFDSPVVNLRPRAEEIVTAISQVIRDRECILDLSVKSRAYVEQRHDCKLIASQYLKTWGEL